MEYKQTPIEATCPECRGPLSEVRTGDLREFQCLVGHKFTARSMLEAFSETEERVLWSAVVALEEATNLVELAGQDFPPAVAERLKQQAQTKRQQAGQVRAILASLQPFQLD